MRPIVVVLIVVSLLAAGLAVFLAHRWEASSADHQASPFAEVLVAARNVPAGTALASGDLRWDKWHSSAASTKIVTRVEGADDPAATYVGKSVRFDLAEGQPLSEAAVSKAGGGVLAGLLAPGMRAVSVSIVPTSAVSGFITPGDRVDVVLSADISHEAGRKMDSGPIAQFASETILENLRVLAVDQQIVRGQGPEGAVIPGKTATLEVTHKQGETLATAGMMGQLSLVLRGADAPIAPPVTPSADPAPVADDAAPPAPVAPVVLPAAPTTPEAGAYTPDTEVSKALEAVRNAAAPAPAPDHPDLPRAASVRVNRGGAVSNEGP